MALIDKEQLNRLKQKATDLVNKAIDQQMTLAVTGLSRSGKTAFITSLVNQLINEGTGKPLSFFSPVHQGRFIAAKRVPQKNVHIKRFDYDGAMSHFSQSEPDWPIPTSGISELRLAIRYRPENSLLKYTGDYATLYVDITDYPGEWLLDLPMLNQTYEQWSQAMIELLTSEPRAELAKDFLARVNAIDPFAEANEDLLADLAHQYTELLVTFREKLGLSLIQPGRFILPGELKDAPILQFFPYTGFNSIDSDGYLGTSETSLIGMLRARFLEYKERVVRSFYKEHFINFDRQIVLADCLSPLNQGEESFNDLQQAITHILESFDYGKSSLLNRLFSPKIDKLLFAATKADHVTPEQHEPLVSLLEQLVFSANKKISYEAISIDTIAIASVQATQTGLSHYQGKDVPVIRGRQMANNKMITLFPGAVPKKLPASEFWKQRSKSGFQFINFKPLNSVETHQALPNIRLDQVLDFLLGDKMK